MVVCVCVLFYLCVRIAAVDLARERVYMYTRIVLSCAFAYGRVWLSEVTLCD